MEGTSSLKEAAWGLQNGSVDEGISCQRGFNPLNPHRKKRTESHKLLSDFHTCAACGSGICMCIHTEINVRPISVAGRWLSGQGSRGTHART